jgi:hypothetical protein
MTDYTGTFSDLVDLVVAESKRTDKITSIIAWTNQAIRACQSKAYFSQRDLIEDQLTTSGADPFIWDPLPADFRTLRSVYYPQLDFFPSLKPPGRIQGDTSQYYYAGAGYYVFAGTVSETAIDVAYYRNSPRLSYYTSALRPAIYDNETSSWLYLSNGAYVSSLATAALEEAARDLVTNWLLFNWFDLIKDGVLSKLYYVLDDPRGPKHLGLYKDGQLTLLENEVTESLNV